MGKPKLLDLYCKAGGATRGYQNAGFEVTGVDIEAQPRYCGEYFAQWDAIDFLKRWGGEYDVIHASPPCHDFSALATLSGRNGTAWLIKATRETLIEIGVPWAIENVEGAPLIDPIVLCGTQFPPLRVKRHRLFESSVDLVAPPACTTHPLAFTHDKRKAHYGRLNDWEAFVTVTGGGNCSIGAARDAMGIDWMSKGEINQAVPPAYTEYIGRQLIGRL